MMECPWGFNQYHYYKIMGGSAFCSCFADALFIMSHRHYEKMLSATTILKANYAALNSSSTKGVLIG